MSEIKFLVCGDTKAPKRNFGDAGIDCFVPNKTNKFIEDIKSCNEATMRANDSFFGECGITLGESYIAVAPGVDIKFPLYIKSRIPENRALLVCNKSGVATKQKLIVGAQLVDASYEGVIHAHVFNASNNTQTIEFGQKIIQLVPIKVDPDDIDVKFDSEITSDKFYEGHNFSRGAGGFGSTGLK